MTQRRTLGEILTGSGRITEADVARALEYQREKGGFFGQALVACGIISEGEVEWSLASQFDLPYVFPDADAVDYEAASLVSPDWALAHLTLPIMKTAGSLKVIVDSPLDTRHVEELAERTGLVVERALASPSKIRELIREVYARGTAADEEPPTPPLELSQALDAVLDACAPRFGVSVRDVKAWVWWDDAGTIRRRPLAGDWLAELERALEPGPTQMTKGQTRTTWSAQLARGGVTTPVEVHFLADESGSELLFHPSHAEATRQWRFAPPPAGIVSEVRLLARSGKARFVVTADPAALGHEILPQLPALLLDPSWRSVYVHADDRPGEEQAFSRRLPAEPSTWASEMEGLRAFHFDVATVDLADGSGGWTTSALDVASVAFLLWSDGGLGPAYEAGIRWRLHIARSAEGELDWSLEPLHV